MGNIENAIRIISNDGKGSRANSQEADYCCETELDITISNSFAKEVGLDVEVEVKSRMGSEEYYKDAAKKAMVWIQLLVRAPRE